MSVPVATSCADCGWTGRYASQAKADYAHRRHSCAKKMASDAAADRRRAREADVNRTPKPCTHPHAKHQHGTHAAYVLDRCKCVPCAAANSRYESDRLRRNAYGRSNLVDAEPVRQHIANLSEQGVGLKQITRLTGISGGVIAQIVYGITRADGTRRPPSVRVRRDTATKILAVTTQDRALASRVDPVGTTRRLQALIALGWSVRRLADDHQLDRQALDRALAGAPVLARTAAAVRVMFDAIGDRRPPETTPLERAAASRARNVARAHRWPSPADWDDDDLDDPYSPPPAGYRPEDCRYDGCAAPADAAGGLCWRHYNLRRGGRRPVQAEVDLDEWAHLVAGGTQADQAATRVGATSLDAIERLAVINQHGWALRLLAEASLERAATLSGRNAVTSNAARARRLLNLADKADTAA